MTQALLATTFAILALALAATSAGCVVLWARLRALRRPPAIMPTPTPTPAPGPVEPASRGIDHRLDELAGRHRAMEWRLARVEASGGPTAVAISAHPGGPRRGRRVDPPLATASESGPTLISVPSLAVPAASSSPSEAAAELDRRFGDVWALADSGASPEAVARETGYPAGQVELILGLRRQLATAAAGAGPDA